MYAVIRRYNAIEGSISTIVDHVERELLPKLRETPGFATYHLLDPGDGTLISFGVFESREGADASTKTATAWARERLGSQIRTAPVIITGAVVAHESRAGAAPMAGD